jgi:hypothetical protein
MPNQSDNVNNINTDDPCEKFIFELHKRIQKHLPNDFVTLTIDEVKMHLEDRVEDLTKEGITISNAKKIALSGFGNARNYAKMLVDSFYETKNSIKWRYVTKISMVFYCLMMFIGSKIFAPSIQIILAMLFALTYCIGSFLGKQYQVGKLALIGMAVVSRCAWEGDGSAWPVAQGYTLFIAIHVVLTWMGRAAFRILQRRKGRSGGAMTG